MGPLGGQRMKQLQVPHRELVQPHDLVVLDGPQAGNVALGTGTVLIDVMDHRPGSRYAQGQPFHTETL